jgi:purine-binding chemotaxis protein CheW
LPKNQWISFQVGPETYAHPIANIKEIIPFTTPAPVPGAPNGVEGILNIRGSAVTILSGRALLSQKVPKERYKWRVIILEIEASQVGISVDSIGDIIALNSSDAEWMARGDQREPIKGTILKDDQLYILTDFSECVHNDNEGQ